MEVSFIPVSGQKSQGIAALQGVETGAVYADCVRVDHSDHTVLYVSGKTGVKDGALVGRTMREQTIQVIENIKASIERQGGTLRDVVRFRIYVTQIDAESIRDVHAVRAEYFEKDRYPASTLVRVVGLVRDGGLVEMEADVVMRRLEGTAMVIQYPARIGSAETRILECGSGDQAVVFLHGVGARADRWIQNLPAFAAAGYRCIAIDLPGHGMARKHADLKFEPAEMRGFLSDLLEHLGVTDCSWIGTSYGGLLALDMAATHPELARSLVLVGCLGLHDIEEPSLARMAGALRVTTPEVARSKLERLVFDPAIVTPEWVEEEYRVNSSPGSSGAMDALARFITGPTGLRSVDLRPALECLCSRIPIALVWGAQDRSVPVEAGRAAARGLPVQLLEIDRACHAPYLERPQVFNDWVCSFLAEQPRRSSTKASK